MLTIGDTTATLGRRSFLRVGSLALGGLTLQQGMNGPILASPDGPSAGLVTDKSVIFLFLHGGPSQIETFDPKMTAPAGIHSANGEVATRIPGITFGSAFPKLAALANRVSIVRSFTTGDGRHDIKPIVGRDTFGANLGSIYSRVTGSNHPETGIPTNALLFPRAVDASAQAANMRFGRFDATGGFGSVCTPFVPGAGGDLQQDMQLAIPLNRLDDRRRLLAGLENIQRATERVRTAPDRIREQAFQTIVRGVADAFDLDQEDPRIVARYDTALRVHPDQIDRKWNNYNNYVDNAKSLGKLLLLARRLCERGCGFVTVTTNFVWDMHADVNNVGVDEGMRYMGLPLDHVLSTFIEDVHAQGLDEKILLVCCGEMGRTPKINNSGGRDHWGKLAPLLLAGGGLRMGQVIGQSTRDAGEPLTEPVTNKNLVATVLHTLFDVGQLRVTRRVPLEISQTMADWTPIGGLV